MWHEPGRRFLRDAFPADPLRIERARRDPLTYVERQATEVILAALGGLPGYRGRFFLKGGILMAVVYGSPRNTGDLDFTTDLPASPDLGERLRTELDRAFPRVCARLGYPDLLLRVQTVREMPRPFAGPHHLSFPALKLGIAFAATSLRRAFCKRKAPPTPSSSR